MKLGSGAPPSQACSTDSNGNCRTQEKTADLASSCSSPASPASPCTGVADVAPCDSSVMASAADSPAGGSDDKKPKAKVAEESRTTAASCIRADAVAGTRHPILLYGVLSCANLKAN
jgi:hypothetical protein